MHLLSFCPGLEWVPELDPSFNVLFSSILAHFKKNVKILDIDCFVTYFCPNKLYETLSSPFKPTSKMGGTTFKKTVPA
jgi:hypothetical protein